MNGAIIGAGISGLATAIALKHKGISITVYEAAKQINPVGAGIILPPNAIQILEQYGLAQQVVQAGISLTNFVIQTPQGKTLSTAPALFKTNNSLFQAIAMQRSKLQEILLTDFPVDLIQTNKTCINIVSTKRKNEIYFSDGSTSEHHYIIAADGLNSTIRASLFPKSKLRYSGQTCWRGTSDFRLPTKLMSQFTEVWGNGSIFGFVAVNKSQLYWFISTNSLVAQQHNHDLTKVDIINRFSHQHPLLAEIVNNTEQHNIVHNDLYDIAPLQSWFTNSVVLAGDAAHAIMPNLGQGGAQALEDSYILAKLLSNSNKENDLSQIFNHYQQQRQARTRRISQNSLLLSKIAHLSNSSLCFIRNLMLQITPAFITKLQANSLYRILFL